MDEHFRSRRSALLAAGLTAIAVLDVWGCAGGQSGNEGDRPGPPCSRGGTLVRGHVIEIGGGCVSVEVESVVATGTELASSDGTVLHDGTAEPGDVFRGRLRDVYAYTHEFHEGELVACFVEPFDDAIALQLIPIAEDTVQIHWAGKRLEASIEELADTNCDPNLTARYEAAPAAERSNKDSSEQLPTAAQTEIVCEPNP